MVITQSERLIIRNWEEEDRDLFREINRDEKVMEFFPFRRSHAECDLLFDRNRNMIAETGLGFYALADRVNNEAMGFCGLASVNLPDVLPAGSIEIGWRLATRFWSNGYATEAAQRLIAYGQETLGFQKIYAFAVHDNHRSIAVMRRLGMVHLKDRDSDHPKVPDSHPHLKRHVLFLSSDKMLATETRQHF
jgi:RimJ/RimL family protein N-acetyltransferase